MAKPNSEKNIEAFLGLDINATKYVVGDGPDMAALQRKYPEVKYKPHTIRLILSITDNLLSKMTAVYSKHHH